MLVDALPLIALITFLNPITVAAQKSNTTTTPAPNPGPAHTNGTNGTNGTSLPPIIASGGPIGTIYGCNDDTASEINSTATLQAAAWVEQHLFPGANSTNATVSGGGSSSTPASFPTPAGQRLRLREAHAYAKMY